MMQLPRERSKLVVWTLFWMALGVRLWFVIARHSPATAVFSDMQQYDTTAFDLLEGVRSPWHAFRPIGYSAILAALYSFTDANRTLIGVLQALAAAALVPHTYQIGRLMEMRQRFALLAAGLVAIHVPLIAYCGFLLTEVVTAYLLTFVLWRLLRPRTGQFLAELLTGLACGVMIAIRPNLLLVAPVLVAYGALRADLGLRSRKWAAVALLLGMLGPVAAVSAYNTSVMGSLTGPSANGGLNFYMNFAHIRTIRSGGAFNTPAPNAAHYAESEVEITEHKFYEDHYYYGKGLRLLREHPERLIEALRSFPETAGIGLQTYWPPVPGLEDLVNLSAKVFFVICLLPASLFGLWAIARRGRDLNPAAKAALWILVLSLVPAYLFLGDPRVRVPFDPLWILLACLALHQVLAPKRTCDGA